MPQNPLANQNVVPEYDASKVDEWRCYLQQSVALKQAHSSKDETWGKLCQRSVNEAVEYLTTNISHISCQQLYNFLADKRAQIATQMNPASYGEGFGISRLRDPAYVVEYTSLTHSAYSEMYPLLVNKINQILFTKPNNCQIVNSEKGNGFASRITSIIIKQQNIDLTTIALFNQQDSIEIKLFHTGCEDIQKIFFRIEPLFQNILNPLLDSESKLADIARIIWWLAHACPLRRGSAATMEMTYRTLMKKAGIPIVPYENLVTLDLEALLEPDIEKFVEKFTSLHWFPGLAKHFKRKCYKDSKNISMQDEVIAETELINPPTSYASENSSLTEVYNFIKQADESSGVLLMKLINAIEAGKELHLGDYSADSMSKISELLMNYFHIPKDSHIPDQQTQYTSVVEKDHHVIETYFKDKPIYPVNNQNQSLPTNDRNPYSFWHERQDSNTQSVDCKNKINTAATDNGVFFNTH